MTGKTTDKKKITENTSEEIASKKDPITFEKNENTVDEKEYKIFLSHRAIRSLIHFTAQHYHGDEQLKNEILGSFESAEEIKDE